MQGGSYCLVQSWQAGWFSNTLPLYIMAKAVLLRTFARILQHFSWKFLPTSESLPIRQTEFRDFLSFFFFEYCKWSKTSGGVALVALNCGHVILSFWCLKNNFIPTWVNTHRHHNTDWYHDIPGVPPSTTSTHCYWFWAIVWMTENRWSKLHATH